MSNQRAATQVVAAFGYQSYFDSTRLEAAIVQQSAGTPFAQAPTTVDVPGYGIALHPSSGVPLAVRAFGDLDMPTVILTPGHVLRTPPFKKLDYGLPFGWLGGGQAVFHILHHPQADVNYGPGAASRMLFHRSRYVIEATPGPGTLRKNWPGLSPWPNATSWNGSAIVPQGTGSILSPEPDIVLMKLRTTPAVPGGVRLSFQWRGVDDFDVDQNGSLSTADVLAFDVNFSAPGNASTFPFAWLPSEVAKLVGTAASLNIIDTDGTLAAAPGLPVYVDIVRYCRVD